jgi:hypothetical protein
MKIFSPGALMIVVAMSDQFGCATRKEQGPWWEERKSRSSGNPVQAQAVASADKSTDPGGTMSSTRHTTSRLAVLLPLLVVAGFAIMACGSGSASGHPGSGITSAQPVITSESTGPVTSPESAPTTDPGSVSPPEPAPTTDQGTTVSGQVVDRNTGQPYAGAIVEFKNLYGGNVHTTTDADGNYSIELPSDTYTALALDENDYNEGFDVTGRPDNAVTVPPSTTVDFVAYPIT